MNSQLKQYWRARSVREQQILGVGGALVILALLGLYVIAPMNKERLRMRTALPELRIEAAALDAAAVEAARLKPLINNLPTQDMRSILRESAAAMQLDGGALSIQQDTPGRVRIAMNRVPFDRFAAWIDALQRSHKLRLSSASIRALPEPGMVSIEAEVSAPAAPS